MRLFLAPQWADLNRAILRRRDLRRPRQRFVEVFALEQIVTISSMYFMNLFSLCLDCRRLWPFYNNVEQEPVKMTAGQGFSSTAHQYPLAHANQNDYDDPNQ